MNKKSGTAGTPVQPIDPAAPHEADSADPGEVEAVKAEQQETQTGKYGSVPVKPFKPPADGEAASSQAGQNDDKKKTSWIEIELVGEDDKPIAGERYRVTLPDKTVDEGTLDQNGWARIEGFDDGSCQVTFPNLDQDAWDLIDAVGPKPPEHN